MPLVASRQARADPSSGRPDLTLHPRVEPSRRNSFLGQWNRSYELGELTSAYRLAFERDDPLAPDVLLLSDPERTMHLAAAENPERSCTGLTGSTAHPLVSIIHLIFSRALIDPH